MLVPKLLERLSQTGVITVLVVDRPEDAVPLVTALLEGGIDVAEVTLRTPASLDVLRAMISEVKEMVVGAGTILTVGQIQQVAEASAAFGVAPGMNPRVVRAAQAVGLPFMPGVLTPSDVEQALECGCRELKFFPAEPMGGLAYLPFLGPVRPPSWGIYADLTRVLRNVWVPGAPKRCHQWVVYGHVSEYV